VAMIVESLERTIKQRQCTVPDTGAVGSLVVNPPQKHSIPESEPEPQTSEWFPFLY
jgi:hypothetical protein